ncbi:hypothetical protein [Antarcticimicrobium luteum]|uniref:Sulfotransferase family protein n=1 Tax=Antarcticimicrobium luteum TaxID=2547397 RepID=A0A4R5VG94_9RHOB|nr:hypothetical protein [Antarcticimicrobium luteum]TDK50902.1 hypothetical protein E1832_04995 [Antarcticimicrobium luteum]
MTSRKSTKAKGSRRGRSRAPARTALVVLGMHRSGTSALAGVLGHMGGDLPKDLMGPADMNAKGFFESNRITGLNDKLLASAGYTWFSLPRFPATWFASPKADEFLEQTVEAIEAEYGRSHLFVMKDPRLCRLMPFWQRALSDAGCRPVYACIHRHPLAVAASLAHWANYEQGYGLLLWLRHVLDAEAETRGSPRVFTSYDRLMTDWGQEVERIGSGLDIAWPRDIATAAPSVNSFLSDSLRHFSNGDQAIQYSHSLPERIEETFSILESWAAGGEDAADHETLDRIRSSLDLSESSFVGAVCRGQELRLHGQHLQRQIEELSGELEKVRAQSQSHAVNHATEQKSRGAAEQRLKEVSEALEQTRLDASGLGERMAAELAARTAAEQEVEQLATALAESRGEGHRLNAHVQAVEAERADLETAVESQRQALTEAEQANHHLQSALAQRSQEAEDLHRQHLGDREKIAGLEAAVAAVRKDYEDVTRRADRDAEHLQDMTRRYALIMQDRLNERLNRSDPGEKLAEMEKKFNLRLEQLSEENDSLRGRLDETRRLAEEDKRATSAEHERIRGQYDAQLRDLEAEREELRARVEQERTDLGGRISELEQYVQALLQSTSWRVTGPLRRVSRLLRK